MDALTRFDHWLFHLVNNQAGMSEGLDAAGVFAATRFEWVIGLTVAVGLAAILGFEIAARRCLPVDIVHGLLVGLFAISVAIALNHAIGNEWWRPRPQTEGVTMLVPPSSDPSLPSDHASAAFALVLAGFTFNRRLAAVVLVESAAMLLGRVFVGLHYPGDILAGIATAVTGTGVGLFVVKLCRRNVDRFLGGVVRVPPARHFGLRLK